MKCSCGKEGKYLLVGKDGAKEYACNKRGRCMTHKEQKKYIGELETALRGQMVAMDYTRQYVGYMNLPSQEGWSWFDAEQNARKVLGMSPLECER